MAGNAWCEGLIQSTYSCCSHPATLVMDTETVGERKSFVLHHARGWYAAAPETDASCSALSWIVAKQKVLFEMEASQVQVHALNVPAKTVEFATNQSPIIAFHGLFNNSLIDALMFLRLISSGLGGQGCQITNCWCDCWCYCTWVDDFDTLTFFDSLT